MTDKYPFTLIKEKIAERQGKALDFAVGTQPYPLSPEISDWIRDHSALAVEPANSKDIAAFALAASNYLKDQYALDVSPECILPTAGGRAAMAILSACTLTRADTVLVTEPGYPAFARLAAQRGASVIVCHLEPNDDFAPDFEYSRSITRESISMVAVNYPNNPSGSTLSPKVLKKLRYLAGDGVILFNDATYGPLVYNDEPRSLLGTEFPADTGPDVVELHSFSKLYPIGPLAVSFLAGSAELLGRMTTYSEYAWSPLSRLQLSATLLCLQDSDRIQRFRDYIPRQLELLRRTLDEIGFAPYRAHSGTYLVCDVPVAIAGEPVSSARAAAKLLMDKFDVAVVPLDTDNRSYLRFSALFRQNDIERLANLRTDLKLC